MILLLKQINLILSKTIKQISNKKSKTKINLYQTSTPIMSNSEKNSISN